MTLVALPASFATTRDALHALAEHVLCPARYRVAGKIGLRATPGGFGTPRFGNDEQVRVEEADLVHRVEGSERRTSLTTLGAAATFVGIRLGAPTEVFTPTTEADPDALLDVDPVAAAALGAWYAFANAQCERLHAAYGGFSPSETQLWPEHFDIATEIGDAAGGTRANYGASPGDRISDQPYLYVGPWDASKRIGALAAYPFGAALRYDELRAEDDPGAAASRFFTTMATQLLGPPAEG